MDTDYFSLDVKEARRFFLPQKGVKNAPFIVVAGGVEKCSQDYVIDRKTFPYSAVEFVTFGTGELVLGRKKYSLTPGMMYWYGPGIAHRISRKGSLQLTKYFINLQGGEAEAMLKKVFTGKNFVSQCSDPLRISRAFDELIDTGQKSSLSSNELVEVLGKSLLLKMKETATPLGGRKSMGYFNFYRCQNTIVENYLKLQTLEDIASVCNLNKMYICRLYKQYGKESPYQHLTRLKMNHAINLLQTEPLLVREVAARMGYDDQFNFSRTFKKTFGIAPSFFQKS